MSLNPTARANGVGPSAAEQSGRLYRILWRWHFYAGLFCIPFVLLLALTGTTYLFKPQIEAAFDRPYDHLVLTGPSARASQQVDAALNAVKGAELKAYHIPTSPTATIRVSVTTDKGPTLIYVHPNTLEVLKVLPEKDRFMSIIRSIHGELLMGDRGSLIVELAASWAILMVASGLYLWWPRQAKGLAGVLWPRLNAGKKLFWRDIHAVTGMWISFLALFLLLSGLPWTGVWGEGFKKVREITGTAPREQSWSTRAATQALPAAVNMPLVTGAPKLDQIVERARVLNLAPPVIIAPPKWDNPNWVVQSLADNPIERVKVTLSGSTGTPILTQTFADRHMIDQVVGVSIAAHEGRLFGPLNQALGVLTALGLVVLSVSGFVMWRARAPSGVIGAPPAIPDAKIGMGLGVLILGFALFLPLLGLSMLAVALIEALILRRFPAARHWLGLAPVRTG
jgi:uncharacterized iron-regulated membrane protein